MSFAQKRILIIVISCLLVAGIVFGCYRIEQHKSAENDRQSASLTQKIQPLANQKNALQAKLKKLEADHAAEIAGKSCIIPIFTKTDGSLCSLALPLLKKYGAVGVLAFCNGQLPGDADQLTAAQYQTLKSAGWETALGDNSSIELAKGASNDAAFKAWTTYIDETLKKMDDRKMDRPKMYYFDQPLGELSKGAVINALRARGFEGMVIPKSDEAITTENNEYNGFTVLGFKRIFDNGSTVSSLFSELSSGGRAAAVSVQSLTQEITDSNLNCSVTRYEKMLKAAAGSYKNLTLKSFSAFKNYRAELEKSANKSASAYEQQRKELLQQIAELEKQINKSAMQ